MTSPLPTRLEYLSHAAGWLDPPSMLTLANSQTSDAELAGQATALTVAAQDQPNAVQSPAYSPVDTAPVDQTTQNVQLIHNTVGVPTHDINDLSDIQNALNQVGYGQHLTVNGVWNPDWQQAYSQMVRDNTEAGYQGQGHVATIRTKSFLSSLVSDLNPVNAVDSMIGFVRSIPHDLRQLAADTAGGVATLLGEPGALLGTVVGQHSFSEGQSEAASLGTFVGSAISGEAQDRYAAETEHPWGRLVEDLGTALMFVPVGKAATAATRGSLALGREAGQTGTANATARLFSPTLSVQRAPGTIARTLIGTPEQVGLLTRQTVANIPLLGRVGPALVRAEPGYYRLRTLLAAPYKYPVVANAGQAFQKTMLGGLGVEATADLSQGLGQPANDPFHTMVRTGYLDPLDFHIGLLRPIGLDDAISDLGLILHGPIPTAGARAAEAGNAAAAGSAVKKASDAWSKVLGGPLTPFQAWTQAVAAVTRTKPQTVAQWADHYGGMENLADEFTAKYAKHAAAMQAEHDMLREAGDNTAPTTVTSAEGQRWVFDRADEIMTDPVRLQQAMARFGNPQNTGAMIASFVRELVNSDLEMSHATGPGGAVHAEISRLVRGVVTDPDLRSQLITPDVIAHKQQMAAAQRATGMLPGETKPLMQRDWLEAQHLNQAKGRIGLARPSTWTTQTMDNWLKVAQREWADLTARSEGVADPEQMTGLMDEQKQWLAQKIHDLGTNTNKDVGTLSQVVATATGQKGYEAVVKAAESAKDMMSSEVWLPHDADPRLEDVFGRVKQAGYKVVWGKGIGHGIDLPVTPTDLGRDISRRRLMASRLGLSDVRTSQADVGAVRYLMALHAVNELEQTGKINIPSPLWNGKTILAMIRHGYEDEGRPIESLTTSERIAQGFGTPMLRRAAKGELASHDQAEIVPRRFGTTKIVAKPEDIASSLVDMNRAQVQSLGLRDIRRKSLVAALTDPDRVPWLAKDPEFASLVRADGTQPGLFTRADAHRIVDAILEGYAANPGYMLGFQHWEDMFRLPMGFLGQKWGGRSRDWLYDHPNPLTSSVLGLSRLPNAYYQLMTRSRFRLAPFFDLRRVAKTNLKFALAGIRPTVDPLHALLAEGGSSTVREAHALLDKAFPQHANPWVDADAQLLAGNGVYGLFNPRHYAAWAARDLANAGKSLDDIRDTIIKTTTYGDRTAMERTANTVFFPFSFDKTLYRSVGGYLLDHPAQALIMLRGFQAYDEFSQHHMDNPLAYTWWQQRAPLLNEFARLNAFAHGIGPGELGGINAPLLQLFHPMSVPSTKDGHQALSRIIPVLHDLNRVIGETSQTATSAYRGVQNALYQTQVLLGEKQDYPLAGPPSTIAAQYTLPHALTYKAQLTKSLAPVLAYNRKHPSKQYQWPVSDAVPNTVRGQNIDSTTISMIVSARYPSFNPVKAAEIAEARREQLVAWSGQHADDPAYAQLGKFTSNVNKLATHVRNNDRDPAKLAQAAEVLRDYARTLLAHDQNFAAAYKKFYEPTLGPLTLGTS